MRASVGDDQTGFYSSSLFSSSSSLNGVPCTTVPLSSRGSVRNSFKTVLVPAPSLEAFTCPSGPVPVQVPSVSVPVSSVPVCGQVAPSVPVCTGVKVQVPRTQKTSVFVQASCVASVSSSSSSSVPVHVVSVQDSSVPVHASCVASVSSSSSSSVPVPVVSVQNSSVPVHAFCVASVSSSSSSRVSAHVPSVQDSRVSVPASCDKSISFSGPVCDKDFISLHECCVRLVYQIMLHAVYLSRHI